MGEIQTSHRCDVASGLRRVIILDSDDQLMFLVVKQKLAHPLLIAQNFIMFVR